MALALSKSVSEEEEKGKKEEVYDAVYPSTQEKIAGVKRTLEEFGFKTKGGKSEAVRRNGEVNVVYWGFRWNY